MFSKDITGSDTFREMPASTQSLYFHLGMDADDDGFLDSYKGLMRSINVSEDDLKLLIAKRFLILFPSKIIVVKHWKINNTIRGDRYTETKHLDEKKALIIKQNGSYTENIGIETGEQIKRIEKPKWLKTRQQIRKESSLPDSFDYKIRQAFLGKPCPVCGVEMRELSIEDMGYESKSKPKPSIQHNKPISLGGKHELGNISVICHSCNVSIQDKETGELNSREVIEVWNTVGNQSATQNRIGEDRIEKERIGEDRIEKITSLRAVSLSEFNKTVRKQFPKKNPFVVTASEDKLIVNLIHSFEGVNPSFSKWYENTTQRKAAKRLIETHGLEKAKEVIYILPKTNTMEFFPTITTPVQLEDKWAQLASAIAKKKSEKPKGRGFEE